MPAKRRLAKARSLTVSGAARDRFRAVGGILFTPAGAGVVTDPELASLIGRLPLVAYPDLQSTFEQLRGTENEA
jgi:hypothetical protein